MQRESQHEPWPPIPKGIQDVPTPELLDAYRSQGWTVRDRDLEVIRTYTEFGIDYTYCLWDPASCESYEQEILYGYPPSGSRLRDRSRSRSQSRGRSRTRKPVPKSTVLQLSHLEPGAEPVMHSDESRLAALLSECPPPGPEGPFIDPPDLLTGDPLPSPARVPPVPSFSARASPDSVLTSNPFEILDESLDWSANPDCRFHT